VTFIITTTLVSGFDGRVDVRPDPHFDRGKHNQYARHAEQKAGDQPSQSFMQQCPYDGASCSERQN
jgi:hypothetical protein